MIHLSSEFYAELAHEVAMSGGRVVEFRYDDPHPGYKNQRRSYDVVYGYRSNPVSVLLLDGWRVVSNDFSLLKLDEWLGLIKKIKK